MKSKKNLVWSRHIMAAATLTAALSCAAATDDFVAAGNPLALKDSKARAACINCGKEFDTATHKLMLVKLLDDPYTFQLRRALFWQDKVHQFESKAHFDNCDFDSASNYVDELIGEAGRFAADATKATDQAQANDLVAKAFFSLGQALHAVQDFYAHSNYVELQIPKYQRPTDIPVLKIWRPDGKAALKQMTNAGLVSGYVSWGLPQKCAKGALSHKALAKDDAKTVRGKVIVASMNGISLYEIASILARQASIDMLQDIFKQWPVLQTKTGGMVAFETVIDGREKLKSAK